MKGLIPITFAFLAFAFYEMSGGEDFVPRKAELIEAARLAEAEQARAASEREAAAAKTAQRAETQPQVTRIAVEQAPTPAPTPEPSRPARGEAIIERIESPVGVFRTASDRSAEISLVSLEQSAVLFAQPTARLIDTGTTGTIGTEASAANPARSADIRAVDASRVNMRNGPGTDYAVLTSLARGTEVEVLDSDGGWVKLRPVGENSVGWMAASLLTDPQG